MATFKNLDDCEDNPDLSEHLEKEFADILKLFANERKHKSKMMSQLKKENLKLKSQLKEKTAKDRDKALLDWQAWKDQVNDLSMRVESLTENLTITQEQNQKLKYKLKES